MAMEWLSNVYIWMVLTFVFLIMFIILFIFLWLIAKKTHGTIELKAWLKGVPIALFFQDSGYVEWKPVKPEAGIIYDKQFGSYIINEMGTYIDRRTKNIIIPFDAALATSVNIKAAKVTDDLQYIFKDKNQIAQLRTAVMTDNIEDDKTLTVLKTSVQISAIKNMMTAMIPHNITAKIEKAVASRMKGYGKVDGMQVALIFAAVLGAIIMGYILLKTVAGN